MNKQIKKLSTLCLALSAALAFPLPAAESSPAGTAAIAAQEVSASRFKGYYTRLPFDDQGFTGKYADIVAQTDESVTVHWRYAPDITQQSFTDFRAAYNTAGTSAPFYADYADETFTIHADGKVDRTVKNGCYQLDEWNDPRNQIEQTLQLAPDGIRETPLRPAQLSKTPEPPVTGSPVKSGLTKNLIRQWRFDEGAGGMLKMMTKNNHFLSSDEKTRSLGVCILKSLSVRVLSSLKRMNMFKIFTIIEKQVYKKVTHFGGQISKDFEVFLRRYPSPFRSGFERGQPQDYAANLQSAA